jgi:hypothetical protein
MKIRRYRASSQRSGIVLATIVLSASMRSVSLTTVSTVPYRHTELNREKMHDSGTKKMCKIYCNPEKKREEVPIVSAGMEQGTRVDQAIQMSH